MGKKQQGLSAGNLTMMALSSIIGGSFFLGTAVAFNAAGPSVIISYIIGGAIVYFILYALSEMTVANPSSGSFRTFAVNYLGHGSGFVVGWVYWIGMILSMSSEAAAISILLKVWLPNLSIALSGSLIIISVTLINLLGVRKISQLSSSLSAVKLIATVLFIIISILAIMGLLPKFSLSGIGELRNEPFMPGGIKGIAGSMLVVMFAYAGFEIIGLAASETAVPEKTIPKSIRSTVIALVGLYILSAFAILFLVPTAVLNESTSPMVAALNRLGMGWAGSVMNMILVTAILSTALSSMFGIGRILRSLADKGDAPIWLKDNTDIPYRGMIFSGAAMLISLWFSLLFPRVYLFLVSSGGFASLFTYAVIMAAHIQFRKQQSAANKEKSQMPWAPFSSWATLAAIVLVILSMPFISGQSSGLIAGIVMVAVFSAIYWVMQYSKQYNKKGIRVKNTNIRRYYGRFAAEFSKELTKDKEKAKKDE